MNKALFIDRDGVINVDHNYVHMKEAFEPIPANLELIRQLNSKDTYLNFIVTNQAGIARGLYTEAEFLEFQKWVEQFLAEQGIHIVRSYYCPHHPTEAKVASYHRECDCRKPAPGMLLQAAREFDIDLKNSLFIGDKKTDQQAAEAVGCKFIRV